MNIEAKLDALRANPIEPISLGANQQEALSKYNTAGKMRTAAVMVPIIKNNYRYELLLTKRAQHLKDHAGEICFPGGSMEQTDGDHLEAALRETREEVGINSTEIEILLLAEAQMLKLKNRQIMYTIFLIERPLI